MPLTATATLTATAYRGKEKQGANAVGVCKRLASTTLTAYKQFLQRYTSPSRRTGAQEEIQIFYFKIVFILF
jgi:hypothetical protein